MTAQPSQSAAFDPYDVLGVARDADQSAVKAAYRLNSQKSHPDKGGSAEAFQRVRRAYDILRNPQSRERYDQSGDVSDAQDGAEVLNRQAMELLSSLMEQALDIEQIDVCGYDHVSVLVEILKQEVGTIRSNVKFLKAKITRAKRMTNRFKRKNDKDGTGGNVMNAIVDNHIRTMIDAIAIAGHEKKIRERAMEIVKEYEFEKETVKPNEHDWANAGDRVFGSTIHWFGEKESEA